MSEEKDSLDLRYSANPDFILREIAGEAVLVPTGDSAEFSNSIISMNSSAVFLWKIFMGTASGREAIEKAKEEFDYTDEKELVRDVQDFIREFRQHGLLVEPDVAGK
ncbi:MAG: PqqD family protein [Lachnospiraceae bacterium]|nr:PqqD family protein [Lachnospiraceae bacterium]